MVQLLEFKVGDLDVRRFLHGHENVDEPVPNDLHFRLAGHATATAFPLRAWPPVTGCAPAVILSLETIVT